MLLLVLKWLLSEALTVAWDLSVYFVLLGLWAKGELQEEESSSRIICWPAFIQQAACPPICWLFVLDGICSGRAVQSGVSAGERLGNWSSFWWLVVVGWAAGNAEPAIWYGLDVCRRQPADFIRACCTASRVVGRGVRAGEVQVETCDTATSCDFTSHCHDIPRTVGRVHCQQSKWQCRQSTYKCCQQFCIIAAYQLLASNLKLTGKSVAWKFTTYTTQQPKNQLPYRITISKWYCISTSSGDNISYMHKYAIATIWWNSTARL